MSKQNPLSNRPKINQIIYSIRKELHLTQAEVAEKMGMLHDTYSKKERSGNITVDWAKKFANTVGVDPSIFAQAFEQESEGNYFKSDEWKNLLNTKSNGTVLTAKSPSDFIDKIYGTPEPVEPVKPVRKKAANMIEVDATEETIIHVYRTLSKANQTKVRDYIQDLRNK